MKYVQLIWAALLRRKARTVLTLLSVLVAFLLFGALDTVRSTFENAGQTSAGRDRLLVTPKVGIGKPLPYSLLARIKEVPGVVGIEYGSHVVGTYQDPKNVVVVEAHADSFYDLYQEEIEVAPAELAALRRTRTGVLAGETLARKYGWKVGDKIPLRSEQPRKDGSTVWTFDVVGILRWIDPNMKIYEEMLFGNWDYVNEARQSDNDTVAYFSVKVSNVSEVDRVAREIDALTANSSQETKTQSENAWASAIFQQFGDMGLIATSIMGAVFFTLLLLTGHTMTRTVHERIPELAVLKTIGFTGWKILGLVLCESIAVVLLGGIIGLAAATAAVVGIRSSEVFPIPISPVAAEVWLRGLALAAAIGLIVGSLPALRGMRLRIVDALSGR
jgi:putative ABC transport system permease protein